MADLVQNSQLVVGTNVQSLTKVAGEGINAGMPCYLNGGGGDGRIYKARASGNALVAGQYGLFIALTTSYAGQPITVMTGGGTVVLGATDGNGVNGTQTNGQIYCVSYNAGAIAPASDLNSGCRSTVLGVLVASTLVPVTPFLATNAAHP